MWGFACLDCTNKRAQKPHVEESPLVCWRNGRRTIMAIDALIIWLVIGAIAGWLAGLLVKGYGFGLVGNIVVGIVGSVIAGWLLPRIGFVVRAASLRQSPTQSSGQ
jgi:uncharacterized membrane protein YeaQ/YmgE (transglycosylase-associated protein family)